MRARRRQQNKPDTEHFRQPFRGTLREVAVTHDLLTPQGGNNRSFVALVVPRSVKRNVHGLLQRL
jgi:hypothetical protein